MAMRTEIVSTSNRMAEIGPAWDGLWRRSNGRVFQSHGWLDAWWNSQPADGGQRLCVGLCWIGDDLAAVMPLVTRRHRGARVLEWAAKDCSDYCDAIAELDAGASHWALGEVWAAVAESGCFDLAYLSHVRPDAVLHRLFAGAWRGVTLSPGYRSARSLQVQQGEGDGSSWFRGLDIETRDSHARVMRLIGAAGSVSMAVLGFGDAIDPAVERMIELKRRWLADTGQSGGILENDAGTLRALVKELVRQRALQIFEIRCGGLVVAALLSIVTGTRIQAFFIAHEIRFDRALLEMFVLVESVIRAFDRGITEVDLLCVEEGHRFSFANARVDLASYVGVRTLVGRLALVIGERLERARS